MGDGEFSGGGSVTWSVTNTDGESGGGDKSRCSGKDRDPKDPEAKFKVLLNGKVQFEAPVRNNAIKVEW